tara:strand:+ start:93 stop:455 length:363 start_codon:yes stop_codon:yes gene_type:complete
VEGADLSRGRAVPRSPASPISAGPLRLEGAGRNPRADPRGGLDALREPRTRSKSPRRVALRSPASRESEGLQRLEGAKRSKARVGLKRHADALREPRTSPRPELWSSTNQSRYFKLIILK